MTTCAQGQFHRSDTPARAMTPGSTVPTVPHQVPNGMDVVLEDYQVASYGNKIASPRRLVLDKPQTVVAGCVESVRQSGTHLNVLAIRAAVPGKTDGLVLVLAARCLHKK